MTIIFWLQNGWVMARGIFFGRYGWSSDHRVDNDNVNFGSKPKKL